MRLEKLAYVGFFSRVTSMGMSLAKRQSKSRLEPEDRLLLAQLLAVNWRVKKEKQYRWVITSLDGKNVLVFDNHHNVINVMGSSDDISSPRE